MKGGQGGCPLQVGGRPTQVASLAATSLLPPLLGVYAQKITHGWWLVGGKMLVCGNMLVDHIM